MKEYQIAFVGNPNVGKSAWINALSDADFKIGNWPGVTVEKKEAEVIWDDTRYHLIDLPGCYSLSDIGNEETITANYLMHEHVDFIVNVVDASNLARNLYLTLLLRELQIPMVIIFNFMDVVEKCHMQIDFIRLSRRLQIPILPVSAFRKEDTAVVKKEIQQLITSEGFYYPLLSNEDIEIYVDVYNYIDDHLPKQITCSEQQRHVFTLKLLQEDEIAWKQAQIWYLDEQAIRDRIKNITAESLDLHRYDVIASFMQYVKEEDGKRFERTRNIDRVLLHRWFGLPLFFIIFTILLLFVFQASAPFNAFIEFFINTIVRKYVYFLVQWLPAAFQGLLLDGVLAGVGGVLTFIPLMALLYLMLSLLEESGYMSRIAFLLDRLMRTFHLSGKSFVALLLGFGCNVPAVYATRTLDNEKQKRLTAFLVPFMSCGARLPVYVLFASAFFARKAAFMIVTVYGIGILVALCLALLLSRSPSFHDDGIFVMELPGYHLPNMKVVWHKVKEEVFAYIRKAVGIVLWAMIILWGISYFPNGNIETSYMASAAKTVAPIFEPAGFGVRWESVASLPGGILAKETIVGYFDSILGVNKEEIPAPITPINDIKRITDEFVHACKESVMATFLPNVKLKSQEEGEVHAIQSLWQDEKAELRAFCFMVFVLLSIPCIMTIQALYHEYGWKLMLLSIISMSCIPYILSVFLFQLFSLFY